MNRDMDLIREILIGLEEQYTDTALCDFSVDGYDMKTVAYHCKILHDGGYISYYNAQFAGGELYIFGVGSLTWDGHEFLDKIRDDTVWNRTKDTITKKGLPMIVDVVKDVATAIISAMTQAAIKGMV